MSAFSNLGRFWQRFDCKLERVVHCLVLSSTCCKLILFSNAFSRSVFLLLCECRFMLDSCEVKPTSQIQEQETYVDSSVLLVHNVCVCAKSGPSVQFAQHVLDRNVLSGSSLTSVASRRLTIMFWFCRSCNNSQGLTMSSLFTLLEFINNYKMLAWI